MTPKQALSKLRRAQVAIDRAADNRVRAAHARARYGTYSTFEARAEKAATEAQELFGQVEAFIAGLVPK